MKTILGLKQNRPLVLRLNQILNDFINTSEDRVVCSINTYKSPFILPQVQSLIFKMVKQYHLLYEHHKICFICDELSIRAFLELFLSFRYPRKQITVILKYPKKRIQEPPDEVITVKIERNCDYCGFPLDPNDELVKEFVQTLQVEYAAVLRCKCGKRYHSFHFPNPLDACVACDLPYTEMKEIRF